MEIENIKINSRQIRKQITKLKRSKNDEKWEEIVSLQTKLGKLQDEFKHIKKELTKEYQKKYREENKQDLIELSKAWRLEHKDKVKDYNKKYYIASHHSIKV